MHYSKQKITEFILGEKVVWLVLDSCLNSTEDKAEWNGTGVTFAAREWERDRSPLQSPGASSSVRVFQRPFERVGFVRQWQCTTLDCER